MAIIKHTILCPINYDYASSFAHTPLYNIKRSKPEKCVPTTAVVAFFNRPHIIVAYMVYDVCVCEIVYRRNALRTGHARTYLYIYYVRVYTTIII